MTYATEFPDFPASAIPDGIPAAWRDSSWHNDASPSWTVCGAEVTSARLVLWINYPDKAQREFPEVATFMLMDGNGDVLHESEEWHEMREVAERHRLAYAFARELGDSMSPADWAEMRKRNVTYDGMTCASHDFRDSNMDMESAYESTFGESVFGADGHMLDLATHRWNTAWGIAKPRYLTAADSDARTFDAWRMTRGGSLAYGPGQIDKYQVTGKPLLYCVTVSNYSEGFESLFEAELILWELYASNEWERI